MFDGVHIGHRAVFEMAESFDEHGAEAAVFTFDSESLGDKHGKSYRYVVPNSLKLDMIRQAGIKNICCADFSELRNYEAEEFVKVVLAGKMNAVKVVCGPDFRFGRGAAGNVDSLRKYGTKYGFEVSTVDPVVVDGNVVSSSRIRELLSEGDVKKANALLGYRYKIKRSVEDGNHIGRTIDFPTINQSFEEGQLIPAYGVYATSVVIDGKQYDGITNIGVKPTVEKECKPLAETHILGFSGDLYGKTLEVSFSDFLRPERKFDSLDALKNQIKTDINKRLGK
ncbi:MAG: bifunctional riboflavin kinase/FAD synthetase [Oscillospiraceae bacterium]|nr:bifunctional riboflavin kinase/FAD synthetase [Oscillospiraceae bacterium]MBR3534216.1 bifunctional riboflavin kinase/FAD synthetase [Oscillospiraceae bacterium]